MHKILGAALFVSIAVATDKFIGFDGGQQLKTNILNLEYDVNLSCHGCYRSGYIFCGDYKQFIPGGCCKPDDTKCINDFASHGKECYPLKDI